MKMLPVTIIASKKSTREIRDTIPGENVLVGQGGTELPLTRIVSWITPYALYFYCITFETNPSAQSGFKLCLFPKKEDRSLRVHAEFTQMDFTWKLIGNEEQQPNAKQITLQRDSGENLEGVFWGGTLEIPISLLQGVELVPGYTIEGSLCKYCTALPYVYAANLFDREKFFRGEFVLCNY